MSENENKKKPSFKVSDRRISCDDEETPKSSEEIKTSEPELKKEEPKEKKSFKDKIFGKKESKEEAAEQKETENKEGSQLPEINFATFILSMSSSAMLHIGDVPHPETGKIEKNLPYAKQSIDIIEMLKEKTKGNLSSDEKDLLDNILYDLRMRYVQSSKKP